MLFINFITFDSHSFNYIKFNLFQFYPLKFGFYIKFVLLFYNISGLPLNILIFNPFIKF